MENGVSCWSSRYGYNMNGFHFIQTSCGRCVLSMLYGQLQYVSGCPVCRTAVRDTVSCPCCRHGHNMFGAALEAQQLWRMV